MQSERVLVQVVKRAMERCHGKVPGGARYRRCLAFKPKGHVYTAVITLNPDMKGAVKRCQWKVRSERCEVQRCEVKR